MSLRIGVQMDDIKSIDIRGDTTFALMLEAQSRGHTLFTYLPDHLVFDQGRVSARGRATTVYDDLGHHCDLGEFEKRDAADDLDVVLLRQDPPFDMAYITSTHLLDRIHPNTLVVNDPSEVRNAPEKLFVLDYADLMPATMIARTREDVEAFRARHDDIIVKPLYGNGGAGVFKLSAEDTNLGALVELFQSAFREPFIVQEYRPEVRAGDKRILLIDGEIAGAINRVPAGNETRSNMHVGGRPEPVELTARDREICARLGPELKRRGLLLTGIDVIGDYLTEINVTSPTGVREVARFGGADIAAMFWDAVERKVDG